MCAAEVLHLPHGGPLHGWRSAAGCGLGGCGFCLGLCCGHDACRLGLCCHFDCFDCLDCCSLGRCLGRCCLGHCCHLSHLVHLSVSHLTLSLGVGRGVTHHTTLYTLLCNLLLCSLISFMCEGCVERCVEIFGTIARNTLIHRYYGASRCAENMCELMCAKEGKEAAHLVARPAPPLS